MIITVNLVRTRHARTARAHVHAQRARAQHTTGKHWNLRSHCSSPSELGCDRPRILGGECRLGPVALPQNQFRWGLGDGLETDDIIKGEGLAVRLDEDLPSVFERFRAFRAFRRQNVADLLHRFWREGSGKVEAGRGTGEALLIYFPSCSSTLPVFSLLLCSFPPSPPSFYSLLFSPLFVLFRLREGPNPAAAVLKKLAAVHARVVS